jgi:hypothetical protein
MESLAELFCRYHITSGVLATDAIEQATQSHKCQGLISVGSVLKSAKVVCGQLTFLVV